MNAPHTSPSNVAGWRRRDRITAYTSACPSNTTRPANHANGPFPITRSASTAMARRPPLATAAVRLRPSGAALSGSSTAASAPSCQLGAGLDGLGSRGLLGRRLRSDSRLGDLHRLGGLLLEQVLGRDLFREERLGLLELLEAVGDFCFLVGLVHIGAGRTRQVLVCGRGRPQILHAQRALGILARGGRHRLGLLERGLVGLLFLPGRRLLGTSVLSGGHQLIGAGNVDGHIPLLEGLVLGLLGGRGRAPLRDVTLGALGPAGIFERGEEVVEVLEQVLVPAFAFLWWLSH